jgi:hypothetical protein
MGKIKCIKDFPCEICGKRELLQILTVNYSRYRHYSHIDANTRKPQFVYHRNSIAYVAERLGVLSEKSLSSRIETGVVAVGSEGGSDQIGHASSIDQKLQANSSEPQSKRCRGSLAWLGRQTHNLENINGGQTPDVQKSRARIPPPAPSSFSLELLSVLCKCLSRLLCHVTCCCKLLSVSDSRASVSQRSPLGG